MNSNFFRTFASLGALLVATGAVAAGCASSSPIENEPANCTGDECTGDAGALGQIGGKPGNGGAAAQGHDGATGGAGGSGGPGGNGGPGGGGPSFGVVYKGAAHSIDAVSFKVGVPGQGGAALAGPSAPAGIGGFTLEIDKDGLPTN